MPKKTFAKGDTLRHVEAGLPNPITVVQRQGNDKAQVLDAQAGGFWLNRR